MKKIIGLKPATIIEIISALFILLFVYTSVDKFVAFGTLKFALKKFALKGYPIIGAMPGLIAWGLPITELVISLLLFMPRTRELGLHSFLIIMTIFTLYVGYMLIFSPKLPCTCGGLLYMLSWPQHLMFNLFFVALATLAIRIYKIQGHQKKETETAPVIFT
jgi:putative oxidoreductase